MVLVVTMVGKVLEKDLNQRMIGSEREKEVSHNCGSRKESGREQGEELVSVH